MKYRVDCKGNMERWYNLKKESHREAGPADRGLNGSKTWWYEGHLHREIGPAHILSDRIEEYWIKGQYIETKYNKNG
jgi:hypothetical protein